MGEPLFVIKIGGNIIDDESSLSSFLTSFAEIEGNKILVHGGGKLATRVAEAMGIAQQMIDGRRITDAETLKVVTMVYAGYINKNIVATLQSENCDAAGFSGADGNLILSHKRGADKNIGDGAEYGFVGDVDKVNVRFVKQLLETGIRPVVSPVTHDGKGQLLNTNADTIAQEIATALSDSYDVSLIYCFEKRGVLRNAEDDASVIENMDFTYFEQLTQNNVISAGMIPKLKNAFAALHAGVQHISIGHAKDIRMMVEHKAGTQIRS